MVGGAEITEQVPAGAEPQVPWESVVDVSAHVLVPGLINTRHHFYPTLTRAWAPVVNTPLFSWLKNLYPVWARLQPADLELACIVALAELLLSGCTTAADHHYLFPGATTNVGGLRTVHYLESVGWLTGRSWLGPTCGSPPGSPGWSSWRTPASRWGSGWTVQPPTTPRT